LTQPGWGTGSSPAATPRRRPVADIFDETFRLYRQNFVLMVTAFGVFQVPLVLLSLPFWTIQAQWQAQPATNPAELFTMDQLRPLFAATIGITVAGVVLGTFAGAAIAYIVSRARAGDPPPLGHVFQALRRRTASLLGLVVLALAGLLASGLAVATVIVLVAAFVGGAAAFGLLVLVGLVAAVFVATARLTLSIPALIIERTGPLDALRRSWQLSAGSTLRTFGILMLGGLVVGVIGGLVSPIYLPGVAEGFLNGSVISYVIVGLGSGLVQILLGPLLPALLTVLYFDYVDRERELAVSRTV
jgi:MFS family permease